MTPTEALDFIVQFVSHPVGLTVVFKNLSEHIPSDVDPSLFSWDFGDGNINTTDPQEVSYTYANSGTYKVTLSIEGTVGTDVTLFKSEVWIIVNDVSQTSLPDTIYHLIDLYVPKAVFGEMPLPTKQLYIHKWQLYLQPLVNHPIPIEKYWDESYYEALENQLVMQLAVYDWVINSIQSAVVAQGLGLLTSSVSSEEAQDTPEGESGLVKKIVTGPTEVEYFNTGENDSKKVETILNATKKGGVLDTIRVQICMLAERLEIYLPVCREVRDTVPPKVVNHRRPGPFSGPNPAWPVF
jgi:PKD repeat protein